MEENVNVGVDMIKIFIHLIIIYPPIYPPICWSFLVMPLVRVSVYLPWRPADVYCGSVEYSSYQYGLHQYWISHSGLAGCPPAAYSNIVSRIVIIGAELRPRSLQATEYSQSNLPFPHKSNLLHLLANVLFGGNEDSVESSEGFGEHL